MKTYTWGDKRQYSSEYDDEFKAGDLITAYQKGYHEFVEYKDRGEKNAPLVYYKRRFNFNGKPINSKQILVCDALYCRRAKIHIDKSIEEFQKSIELLKKNNLTFPENCFIVQICNVRYSQVKMVI